MVRSVIRHSYVAVAIVGLWTAFCVHAHAQDVRINEFMAANNTTITNAAGSYADWIELYNGGLSLVDLTGWYLTDDPENLSKWEFPIATLNDGGYMVIWADGSSTSYYSGEYHVNFKLSAGGEYLALVGADGTNIIHEFTPSYPALENDMSYGIGPTNDNRYFTNATPGSHNAVGLTEFVQDTRFSVKRGFFTNSFTLEITTATPGASIYYTTDGCEPTTASTLYTGLIVISETTPLLVRAYKDGLYPTDIDAQTYIFVDDVLNQPDDPYGFPDRWIGDL